MKLNLLFLTCASQEEADKITQSSAGVAEWMKKELK